MDLSNIKFFDDCAKKVILMSLSSFNQKSIGMSKKKKATALLRMKKELEIITNNGYASEYYLFKNIIDQSYTQKRLVSIGGQIAYSYVAYLLGISTIDPLERDYNIEMFLGYHHDRRPCFFLRATNDYKKSLVDYLYRIFGLYAPELIDIDGINISIGKALDPYDYMLIGYIENPLLETAEKLMAFHENEPYKEFEKAAKSIFLPHYPSGRILPKKSPNVAEVLKWLISIETLNHNLSYVDFFDGTYEGLLHALAAIHGDGIAEAGLHNMNNRIMLTKDDIYSYALTCCSDEEAYSFMHRICMGRGSDPKYQGVVAKLGISTDDQIKLKRIHYVASEGSLITEAQLVLFIASQFNQK